MKKILSILASFLPLIAMADNVSSDQARKVAEVFLSSKTMRTSVPTLTLKWTGGIQTRAGEAPAFYVFDNPSGGFVIVAGDDSVEPILAYSAEGSFKADGMPSNVQYWFDFLQGGIAYLRSRNFVSSAEVKAQWKAYDNGMAVRISDVAGSGVDLQTADWNQQAPFNLKASEWCNFGSGVTVYTGCVATATAIIMRHHRYPSSGTGTIGGYTYQSEKNVSRYINSYDLGHVYDWSLMPTDNGGNNTSVWTSAQQNAVSQLLLDCGVMSQMHYGIYTPTNMSESGSGAVTSRAPVALVEHMGYDKGYEALDRVYYSRDEWVGRIIASIDAGCPVLFSGSGSGGGHAFILDGYDSDGKILINWGWGGYQNGYYTVPDFGDYTAGQTAYVNIRPDQGGSGVLPFIYQEGLRYSSGPVLNSETAEMTVFTSRVGNAGASTFYGRLCLAHADKDDNIKQIFREINAPGVELPAGMLYSNITGSYSVKLVDIAKGDKIKWFYQHKGSDVFLPARYNLEDAGAVGELPMPDTEATFDIEEGSSVEYFPLEKKLVISSHSGLTYALRNSSGASVMDAAELIHGVLTIDLTVLQADTYTLTLMVADKSKELNFVVGK
ncbi:MAG: C10 family peptidase [Bacteroidales bacterium]|nr:C10 family peptidase [Bacteroidales bacterium]